MSGEQDAVASFLRELLGGREYSDVDAARLQIRHPTTLKGIFSSVVGVLEEAQQIRALDSVINLVRSNCASIEACSSVGLQRDILRFLSDRGLFADPSISTAVLKKVLKLLLYLANHSVDIDDIRAMLGVFRSTRMEHEEPDDAAMRYYVSTLEMIARDSFGPASFFDLNGEFSGLLLPVLDSFPNNGYTFCAWIKFEVLPEVAAPLFTFCGKSGVGITCSFMRSSLMITCFDKRKNDGHVEVPDLITPGRWHFLCITHTHRQIRGSKLDVYLNAELRQSMRLAYPNTALMVPVVKAYLGMRESNGANALRVLLGPTSLFGQALPASIISNIHSVDEYDALVFQFNSFISSSSTSSNGGAAGAQGSSSTSSDGLLVAYDARHSDRLKGLCYDSSGNEHHASAASAGVRLRHAGTFKQAVAQLGGPLICLPLLVSRVPSGSPKSSNDVSNGGDVNHPTIQFEEDAKFMRQMSDLIARPVGVKCVPKVILLIAEIMRHSLVNKFIFRRSQGVRLMALLVRSLPSRYFTADLFTSMDRLRSAVISDRILADEIYKYLLFNFRIWINAPADLQATVFDKLEIMTRKDSSNLSPVATRHFLRTLSWIYWRYPSGTTLSRARVLSAEDVNSLRRRVLTMLRIVLCESPPPKTSTSVIAFASKGKEVKTQLSYESTRTLIFCMIGKPSHPMVPGMNVDGTPALSDTNGGASQQAALQQSTSPSTHSSPADPNLPKTMTEGDPEGGTIIENVPEVDLPDLLQLLIELSVQPTAPAGMLDLFGRLGGLRIWLPLLEFHNDVIRVMTLRLLRTYLFLKCGCSGDLERVNNPDKIHLSIGDSYLIMHALKPEERPVSMGVYAEVLLMILGVQVTENDMRALEGKTEEYDALIDEDVLSRATIWHGNMMPAFLGLVRSSSVTIRMVAIRHLKILFASSTPASAINRQVLIFGSISNMDGTATESSTTEQVPIIEAILSLRGDGQKHAQPSIGSGPLNLYGIEVTGCSGVPMGQLREMVLNAEETEAARINALYTIIMRDDIDFVKSLLSIQSDDDRKKNTNAKSFDEMPKRMKLVVIELMSTFHPNGCVDYITLASYDVISSMICLEVKTNEIAWFLLQDPFTTLSRFITSAHELEVVVVSLLKTTLDKINEMLSAEMNLNVSEGTPTRDSILWCNAESLASLAAAVVLHYDPDTLGTVDPASLTASNGAEAYSDAQQGENLIFWKCERVIWHEAELVDSILGIWQHFASYFHSASDASFARRASIAAPRRNSGPPRSGDGANSNSPPPNYGSRSARDTSAVRTNSGKLGFGFNLLPTAVSTSGSGPNSGSSHSPPPVGSNISARPHPGGPMRQILQLLLRSMYLVLLSDLQASTNATGDDSSVDVSAVAQLQLPANSVFAARINKLEYFIHAMGLGREITQYESSFAPSSRLGSTSGSTVSAGLVTTSRSVKATPGDETTLLLWLVPELSQLINRVRRKLWSDSAVRLAGILASLVPVQLRSSDDLAALLSQPDFSTNNNEVRRRDGFYHEQMAHSRDVRALRRATMFEVEVEAKNRAKAEINRISRFTRTAETSSDCDDIVWLQRVKAKDIDDWMKLRVMVKWGIRHVWGNQNVDSSRYSENDETGVVTLSGGNEFWRIDFYTSSNWIRCRLLPDTDDTATFHNDKEIANSIESDLMNHVSEDMSAAASVRSIVIDEAALEATDLLQSARDQALEEEDEENAEGTCADADASYVGIARRISDVGYLDDEAGNAQAEHEIGTELPTQELVPASDVKLNDDDHSLHDVQISAAAPEAPPAPDYPDFSSIQNRFNRAASVEMAAMSVKSAKGRIGTISSRFSSGIMRLATTRPTKQEVSDEPPVETPSTTAITPPQIDIPNEPEPPESSENSGTETGTTPSSEKSSKPAASPAASEGPSPATTPGSALKTKYPSKHDHWKTLSAPYKTKAYLVLPSGVLVYGMLRIGTSTMAFDGEYATTLKGIVDAYSLLQQDRGVQRLSDLNGANVAQLKRRVWGVRVIRVMHRRRFLMDSMNGLEIFFVDGSSCMFGFDVHGEADLVYATLRERKPPCLAKWGKRLLTAERMFAKSKWTDMWVRREISNFEYLMTLNMAAGRSYNDIAQYPIFPWVLSDYDSPVLDLDDPQVYRDLRRPIGAQTLEGIQRAKETYKATTPVDGSQQLPAYHYSNPYSHMLSVLYFLVRLSPFTNAALGGSEDGKNASGSANALTATFNSIDDAYRMSTTDERRAFELTPEFFYLPDFLDSRRNKILARHFGAEDDHHVRNAFGLARDVALPPWASSAYDFIRQHRLALESDFVSENLHHWIDLIFGYKQSGTSSVEALNSYHIACYPERLDLTTSSVAVRSKLSRRGTCPLQLFRRPHPARMTQDEALEARFPSSHAVAVLSSRRQVRRHDLASKHTAPVTAIRFSNASNHGLVGLGSGPALGSGTGIGAHSGGSDHGSIVYTSDSEGVVLAKRYLNSVADQSRSCPFTLVDVDQWWKLPTGSLVEQGVVFYEQMISCGYWDGSWRIHWSADGELLQRIAFHKKPILCMARSEDDFTGDLALAFGSEDCTVSVWALSKAAATRSRRMFASKKELPVGGLPWVLLVGHTSPVVAVALNVDLDVVVSSSKENTILLHSLRGSAPLHSISISPPTSLYSASSVVADLVISSSGDTLIHMITKEALVPHRHLSRSNSIFSDDKSRFSLLENPLANSSSSDAPSSNDYVQQSQLYLLSINGRIVSHKKLVNADGSEQVLLRQSVLFTRSSEYIITASGGQDAAIDVRDAGDPSRVMRRIECKRPSADLTCISLSQDERCLLCGYEDGAVIAYALHFGIADGCKSADNLEKKAREREAEAIALANKRDELKNKRDEMLPAFLRGSNGVASQTLWITKASLPAEPLLEVMQGHYTLLKQNCVSGEPAYEALLHDLWHAIYSQEHLQRRSSLHKPIVEENLLVFSDGEDDAGDDKKCEREFERVGETWSRLGFQRPDPTTDFRAGGMLSLQCLVYFATHYPNHAVRMVTSQVPGSHENTYPWGPAGINVTCMVARLFWKFDGELVRERQPNWPLFTDSEALYKIFSEVFVLFDYLWNEMNANYGSFSKVIQATSDRIMDALEESRGDLGSVMAELRTQSYSTAGKKRRPSSRSMEDFLTSINSNISSASSPPPAFDGLTGDGSSTPPRRNSLSSTSPRSSWSFSRLSLGSRGGTSSSSNLAAALDAVAAVEATAAAQASTAAPAPAAAPAAAPEFDPFAGNDIRGLELKPEEQGDDPFACLL